MLRRTICKLLLALLAQCLATALLLACAAGALASIKRMPWELLPLLATAGAGAGAFLGGWLAARLIGERGLVWGLACGAVSGAAVLLVALALRGEASLPAALTRVGALFLAGAAGGILGVGGRRRVKF